MKKYFVNGKQISETEAILINGEKSYIAVTASKSQAFRSMKGAEKFMAAREYQRI